MARGHPDWSPVIATSLTTIKGVDVQAASTQNTTLWDPAAGLRVRLLAYHVMLSVEAAGGASGGEVTIKCILREATSLLVIDRWAWTVELAANARATDVVDGGLSVLPGGGWPLPVDVLLQMRSELTLGGTTTATVLLAGMVAGLEE